MIDFRLGAKNRAFSRPRSRNRASITTCSSIARDDDATGVCCEFYGQGLFLFDALQPDLLHQNVGVFSRSLLDRLLDLLLIGLLGRLFGRG